MTGRELWRVEERSAHSGSTRPVVGHGLVFIPTGFPKGGLLAIRPNGRGDVTATHVAWRLDCGIPNKPSLALAGDLLFMVTDGGVAQAGRGHHRHGGVDVPNRRRVLGVPARLGQPRLLLQRRGQDDGDRGRAATKLARAPSRRRKVSGLAIDAKTSPSVRRQRPTALSTRSPCRPAPSVTPRGTNSPEPPRLPGAACAWRTARSRRHIGTPDGELILRSAAELRLRERMLHDAGRARRAVHHTLPPQPHVANVRRESPVPRRLRLRAHGGLTAEDGRSPRVYIRRVRSARRRAYSRSRAASALARMPRGFSLATRRAIPAARPRPPRARRPCRRRGLLGELRVRGAAHRRSRAARARGGAACARDLRAWRRRGSWPGPRRGTRCRSESSLGRVGPDQHERRGAHAAGDEAPAGRRPGRRAAAPARRAEGPRRALAVDAAARGRRARSILAMLWATS